MDKLQTFLLVAPVLLFSMVAHEYAHGYAALKQGDNTALMLGRLTFNPMKHIDPVLTVIMPLLTFFTMGFAFGGAKPVPVNPRLYRNYRRGDIIVSLAGIATNCALAVVLFGLVMALGLAGRAAPALADSAALLQLMFLYGIMINLVLAAFNLLPIPPLDGSHVMKHLLPPKWAWNYAQLGRYGFVLLIALLTFGGPVLNLWMRPVHLLNDAALRALMPYVLPSPFTS
ncbi:MAG: site-2 protease family protein [Gemmatimonadetes bacterium]|nr:site-2 protease family protein [Gemmatimonadota bacterium]MBI3567488.1 site-2 protease family protein [Gemmatimonadota bacterium]